MTFRTRMLIVFVLTALIPVIALAFFVRGEMTERLAAQYEQRVESLVTVIEEDLAQEGHSIASALALVRDAARDDNRLRRATIDRAADERRYLLDYAGDAMRLSGLSMLQIQDDAGRILSSGHFRNEYDRLEPELPALLIEARGSAALVHVRAPDSPFLALCSVDSLRMGGRRFIIVGGVTVQEHFLGRLLRDEQISVALVYPGGEIATDGTGSDAMIARELDVPYIGPDRSGVGVAVFRVSHGLGELQALRSSIDRWFLVAVAATAILAVLVVSWLAARISRPLVALADKTSRIDLDRLDIDFDARGNDEIGVLSRGLRAMTERLRASATQIKEAERRATLGELARQVNHDIKNGLTPIRNVFRHLMELSSSEPQRLPGVFEERRGTLDSSIAYLEKLAANYARLSRRGDRRPCDVNEVVHAVVADRRAVGPARLEATLTPGAVVVADPVSLLRIVENLVDNAIDSVNAGPGRVTVSTEHAEGESSQRLVRLVVADTGAGMNDEQRARVFEDFYTTKDDGTGLGLSIVRRLVMDLDGSIRVESDSGVGSRFVVDLPAHESQERKR